MSSPYAKLTQGELEARYASFEAVVEGLRTVAKRQELRIAELERELAGWRKNSSNSSKPPSSDIVKSPDPGKGKPAKRKRGRQPGNSLHDRPLSVSGAEQVAEVAEAVGVYNGLVRPRMVPASGHMGNPGAWIGPLSPPGVGGPFSHRHRSMIPKVYIDGHVGTVGLRIHDWLSAREDLELVSLPEELRKDSDARRDRVLSADIAVLCLPDEQAREAAAWVAHRATRLIDASTAHRVAEDWVYGLPELCPTQRVAVRDAKLVSNPGGYASAVVLLIRPVIDERMLATDAPLVVHALSGYSGGGRSLIEKWEDPKTGLLSRTCEAPYAFDSVHKHIPEMRKYTKIERDPHFLPAVGPFRCGMRVQAPLHASLLNGVDGATLWEVLNNRYRDEAFVRVLPLPSGAEVDEGSFDPQCCNGTNRVQLQVLPHPSGHVTLMATLDNLGKGACGTAIQSLNLMLGLPEDAGLPV